MALKKVVLFTHIQKTAGTTLGRLLKAKYGFWPLSNFRNIDLAMGLHHFHYRGDFPAERVAALQRLDERDKTRVRLVQGHIGYGIHQYFSQPYQYIAALREPVGRVLSHYNQLLLQEWFPYKDEIRSKTLEEFLETRPVDALRNLQVKMLAGVHNDVPGDRTPYEFLEAGPELLDKAKRILDKEYEVVITERFDESVLLLKKKLNWKNAYYIKSNVTKSRKRKHDLDESTLELVRHYNSLDIQLYDYAAAKINGEIEKLGREFGDEVAAFRRSNVRFNQIGYRPIDGALKTGRALLWARKR